MTIEAKIIKDSVGTNGVRLTTFVLKYPRFIHSELMTHRAFSRNASSSRAIPFEKQMQMIKDDMAMPLEFRKNQKGMQAGDALNEEDQQKALEVWKQAGKEALEWAEYLSKLGVHKQYVNRLVEPFAHISVVVTATEYANFFALRHHSMAQPEIAELAKQMWDLCSENVPRLVLPGQWHLPFVSEEEITKQWHDTVTSMGLVDFETTWKPLIVRSVARCARVSYLNHDGTNSSYEADLALYNRLLGSQPIHASPAEHQAMALQPKDRSMKRGGYYTDWTYSGNLRGWEQYRKTLENENINSFSGPLG